MRSPSWITGILLADDVSLEELARKPEGYAGSDIASICKEAGMLALREALESKEVKMQHFTQAMNKISATITDEITDTYMVFGKKSGKRIGEEVSREPRREVGAYY